MDEDTISDFSERDASIYGLLRDWLTTIARVTTPAIIMMPISMYMYKSRLGPKAYMMNSVMLLLYLQVDISNYTIFYVKLSGNVTRLGRWYGRM